MLINMPDYGRTCLYLGVQTNPGNVSRRALWLANTWAPRKAHSFTITNLQHTNYNGLNVHKETGYAEVTVEYYTTSREGEHLVRPSGFYHS